MLHNDPTFSELGLHRTTLNICGVTALALLRQVFCGLTRPGSHSSGGTTRVNTGGFTCTILLCSATKPSSALVQHIFHTQRNTLRFLQNMSAVKPELNLLYMEVLIGTRSCVFLCVLTSFSKAFSIMSCWVSAMPFSFIHRNIPADGACHSATSAHKQETKRASVRPYWFL